ncbi:MAG: hypothetical protein KF833_24135 [Verrucomicrobiae bacterium]|nr:hypothetical protein [Verrucomicrobiae bacterium]
MMRVGTTGSVWRGRNVMRGWLAGLAGVVAGGAIGGMTGTPAGAAEHWRVPGEWIEARMDRERREVTLRFRDRTLLVYGIRREGAGPGVVALHTLRGENVLEGGLGWGWEGGRVPGAAWEADAPTIEVSRDEDGPPRATVRETLRWRVGEGALALEVRESRTLGVTVEPGWEEVRVDWESRVEAAGDGAMKSGRSWGLAGDWAGFEGWGFDASEKSWDLAAGTKNWDSEWVAVASRLGGREAMVVHAVAVRGEEGKRARWRVAGVGGGGVRVECGVEGRGPGWWSRYRVLVYPAHQNAAFVAERLGVEGGGDGVEGGGDGVEEGDEAP